MKKKSIAARLGIAAMALTLITTSLSSGTLAKYTESFEATTSLSIARWNVGASVKMGSGATATTLTSADTTTLADLYATAAKKKGVAANKIAPGMTGGFEIDLTTAVNSVPTEVDTEYSVYIDASKSDLPTNFKMYTGSSSSADIFSKEKVSGLGYLLTTGTSAAGTVPHNEKVDVNWEWPYYETDTTDEADLALGQNPPAKTTFTIRVVFTQVEPTAGT